MSYYVASKGGFIGKGLESIGYISLKVSSSNLRVSLILKIFNVS